MADFSIRSDSVDVEQIMRQIRARIKEKRGVDYTEEEVRELASVKLEKFLNPRAVRSELVEHYRRQRSTLPPPPDNFEFEDSTLYESHRPFVRWLRQALNPLLKLFFNPNPVILALHRQTRMNAYLVQRTLTRDDLDTLNYEVLNNIVLELTRLGIEVKNLKMRIEAMAARQEFGERRARAFESAVESRTVDDAEGPRGGDDEEAGKAEEGEGRGRRRRRRRGRRRPQPEGPSRADGESAAGGPTREPAEAPARDDAATAGETPGPRDAAPPPEPGTEQ